METALKKMKIAYVYSTMACTGRTERMITEEADYLSDVFSYDVNLISYFQLSIEKNFFKKSIKIKQMNLACSFFAIQV